MKFRACVSLAAVTVAAAVLVVPASAADNKEKPAAKGGKAAKAGVGQLGKKVAMAPKELQFGMSLEQVARVYDRLFDKEFLPLYKKAEPGSQMAALDAELKDKKALIRRNKIEFGDDPTGVDYSPLKGEYSYSNGESMTKVIQRSGTPRNFFFFSVKLWKVYDEHKLGKGTLGESFQAAVENLAKKFGAPPKMVEADPSKGRNFAEAQWQDASLLIRAINREGEKIVGVVYVDRSYQDNLDRYRTHKAKNPHEMDREVKSVTANPPEDFTKEKPADKDKKGKDKPKPKPKK